jgi:hypothetical protein
MNATTLSKWLLVAATVGAGLSHLILGSHVRGGAASLDQVRASPAAEVNVLVRVEIARAPPGETGARFRFGFLEFDDDPDAPAQ